MNNGTGILHFFYIKWKFSAWFSEIFFVTYFLFAIYVNFLRENAPGLHHIIYFVGNLDKAVKDYLDIGFEVVHNGTLGSALEKTH